MSTPKDTQKIERERLRISIISAEMRPGHGGISLVARLMVKALSFSESVRCVTLTERPEPDLGVDVSAAGGSKFKFGALLARELFARRALIYDFGGLARLHPRHFVHYACWMHGVEAWEGAAASRIPPLKHANLLLSNSQHTLARAERTFGEFRNAEVCWLGTESDEPPSPPSTNGPPTLLTLARIDEPGYKGHNEILEVWPRVVARVPDARWIVAGGGPGAAHFRRRAADSSAADTIHVRGFVEERDIAELWGKATAFAMPSRGEGFGLVYVEAMRNRIPVLASVHDAGGEINVHQETGFNVDLTRAGELEEQIVSLLADRGEARRMGEAGFRRWQAHFSFSAFRNRFLPLVTRYAAE